MRSLGVCAVVLGVWLIGALTASASAEPCPNAQFRSGPSERLPDCRVYEQVSPVEKGGLDAVTLDSALPAEVSPCAGGEACTVAYMSGAAAFAGAPGNDFPDAYLATRGGNGWRTTPLTPPNPDAPTNGKVLVAYAFSTNLSEVVLRAPLAQLTEDAPAGVYNLFLRDAGGGYSLVTASAPPVPPQPGCGTCFEREDVPAFAGASADFGHILFEANDSLLAGAPGGGVENLYETASAKVRLVGVLPDGSIPSHGATAGAGIDARNEHTRELDHAISQDGSRVLFEAAADGGPPEPQQAGRTELYDRVGGASTVEVSAPAPGAQAPPSKCETAGGMCDPGSAQFWAASADGSVVYFTSKAALTKQSFTGPEETPQARELEEEETGEPVENAGSDLYRYDVESGALTDVSIDGDDKDPNGADVLGVVGASEDGSYVYFVAEGHLGAPEPGGPEGQGPNLYVWHETTAGASEVKFVATLQAPEPEEQENIELMAAGPGVSFHSDVADWTSRPTESQAYVTPDGKHLAFMSVRPLTGYDNEDQATREADHEVFEYDAESGNLECASCDPSGARPLGSAFLGARLSERVSTPFHQPRSLSDDGSRLFFSSPDPLVTGLAGGSTKVFEHENGNVRLISGMQGAGEDLFLDASASGGDVFFATREQLVPSDEDELVDVYDARVDGGLPAPPAPTPCQDGACQGPPDPPPSFSSPISASFTGLGNIAPASRSKLTRKQLLARALARCRKLANRKKRAVCIAAARRRYMPKPARPTHSSLLATCLACVR
jgi:hypothetical protein